MGNEFELSENDVLSVDTGASGWVVVSNPTFKMDAFMKRMKECVPGDQKAREKFFNEGLDCEVLRPGENWQKGKIRVRIEFCPAQPSQPPSPLDDLRQQIKETEG